jgi:hypothetical protein
MLSYAFSLGYHRAYNVTRLKSFGFLLTHQVAPKKPERIEVGALIRTSAGCFDGKRWNVPVVATRACFLRMPHLMHGFWEH